MQTLRDLTSKYWKLSRLRAGKDPGLLTVGDALESLGDIVQQLGPNRPLLRVAKNMQQEIIINGGRRKAS